MSANVVQPSHWRQGRAPFPKAWFSAIKRSENAERNACSPMNPSLSISFPVKITWMRSPSRSVRSQLGNSCLSVFFAILNFVEQR